MLEKRINSYVKFLLTLVIMVNIQSCDSKKTSLITDQNINNTSTSFVGSRKCQSCHSKEYKSWIDSDHEQAMKIADSSSILADFNNTTFTHKGITNNFTKQDNEYYVNTIGRNGEYQDFKIVYTFGIYPLQQYITELSNGKYQCLTTAWDTKSKKWYNLSPDIDINHKDWLHWTGGGMNWNNMCADCHSTNVRKNYDKDKKQYHTTYKEINVSCESCHGPSSNHVYHYEQNLKSNPPTLYMRNKMSSTELVDKCARCHARRSQLTEHFDYKGSFLDHYKPSLLVSGIYELDGQILDEDYVYGSFVQSKMYHNGVSCKDCHDVHSLKLIKEGNALCLSCHDSSYDTQKHHFHQQNTDAAQCINCHMTGKHYMGNDYRRDHSFRVPRPDQSVKYNTPNACNNCHQDKSTKWSSDVIVKNYGSKRKDHFSDHLLAGYYINPKAFESVVDNYKYPEIVRATALNKHGQQALNPQILNKIKRYLHDSSSLVRNEAILALSNRGANNFVSDITPLLKDSIRLVRISAARHFHMLGHSDISKLEVAYKEYLEQLNVNADFASGQYEYGLIAQTKGNQELAIKHYQEALIIDQYYNTARMNLAILYYEIGKITYAISTYKKIIEQEPELSHPYYMLGLLYNESGNDKNALFYLKLATEKQPANPNAFYNYALKLQEKESFNTSINALQNGLKQFPNNERLLYAKFLGETKSGLDNGAKKTIKLLVQLFPENIEYRALSDNYR